LEHKSPNAVIAWDWLKEVYWEMVKYNKKHNIKMREFVIDRSKWRSGEKGKYAIGKGTTEMKNEEGYMCCLGQICNHLHPDKKMINVRDPEDFYNSIKYKEDNFLVYNEGYDNLNTTLSNKAMYINDTVKYNIKERESKLKELFAEHNIKLKFIGKSVKY
jgi:hypothetical protein